MNEITTAGLVRVRILKPLNTQAFEPFDVSRFRVGEVYDVGHRLAELLILDGCADALAQALDQAADYPPRRRDKASR